jgi:hypothetical protein
MLRTYVRTYSMYGWMDNTYGAGRGEDAGYSRETAGRRQTDGGSISGTLGGVVGWMDRVSCRASSDGFRAYCYVTLCYSDGSNPWEGLYGGEPWSAVSTATWDGRGERCSGL